MAVKKPKNTGALFHNYNGFFSIVMLALVDGQYKFRWADAGTAGSCSDAQIFNASQLMRRIEDGRKGFPGPAPITQGGRDVSYFILADDAFAMKTWLMKPYGRRMLTRGERIANYRISRGRRGVENAFGTLVSRFRVMRTTIELPSEAVREVAGSSGLARWQNITPAAVIRRFKDYQIFQKQIMCCACYINHLPTIVNHPTNNQTQCPTEVTPLTNRLTQRLKKSPH